MLQIVVTRKFAHRLIDYIFTVWDYEYVLNRLPELNVTIAEVHRIIHDVHVLFPVVSRTDQYDQCKKELISLLLKEELLLIHE